MILGSLVGSGEDERRETQKKEVQGKLIKVIWGSREKGLLFKTLVIHPGFISEGVCVQGS